MLEKKPILIILKPEIFDPAIRLDHEDVFLPGVEFPSPEVFIRDLFEGIISEYEGPFFFTWKEADIRIQYNQPHHFLSDVGFTKNRVDTFVDMYSEKKAAFALAFGDTRSPGQLNLRKKEIRKRFMRNPDIPFYNLYHVSDTFEDAKREIAIYQKYIDGSV